MDARRWNRAAWAVVVLALVIRLVSLWVNAPPLFTDEAAAGVDAHRLLTTGHMRQPSVGPFFVFHANSIIGMLYRVLLLPVVGILGLTPVAVRIPSALSSVLSVGLVMLVVRRLSGDRGALGAGLLLAVCPWSLELSRFGHEAALVPAAVLLGVWTMQRGLERTALLPWSALCWGLGLYTYANMWLLVPLFVAVCLVIFRRELMAAARYTSAAAAVLVLSLLPLIHVNLFGKGQQRFGMLSVFHPLYLSQELHEHDAAFVSLMGGVPALHGVWDFMRNMLIHFGPAFLFVGGDHNLRHHTGLLGELPLFIVVPLVLGVILLAASRDNMHRAVGVMLALSPAAASLTFEGIPHALRAGSMLPLLMVTSGVGMEALWRSSRKVAHQVAGWVLVLCVLQAVFHQWDACTEYPKRSAAQWQWGSEVVAHWLEAPLQAGETVRLVGLDPANVAFYLPSSLDHHPRLEILPRINDPRAVLWLEPGMLYVLPGDMESTQGAFDVVEQTPFPSGETAWRLVRGRAVP